MEPNKLNYRIETPPLSQGDVISFTVHSTNFKLKNNIKLTSWSNRYINIKIVKSESDSALGVISNWDHDSQNEKDPTNVEMNIDLSVCVLSSEYKHLRIDNRKGKYSLNLIGDILTETGRISYFIYIFF